MTEMLENNYVESVEQKPTDNKLVENRREILFLYDVTRANPNGDPDGENRPRSDKAVNICIVSDNRIKRTIRDQIIEWYSNSQSKYHVDSDVFIQAKFINGKLMDKNDLIGDLKIKDIIERYIDVRLFGLTYTKKKKGGNQKTDEETVENDSQEQTEQKNNKKGKKNQKDKQASTNDESQNQEEPEKSLTGPVQFHFGESLHKVDIEEIKGTTVLASVGNKKGQGTFTSKPIVQYALINCYGIVNENAAKDTRLKEEDIDIMMKALWVGHKAGPSILTSSKLGHMPRLLIEIIYKKDILSQIGMLNQLIGVKSDKPEEKIRSIKELTIDLSLLQQKVQNYKDKIEKIRYAIDDMVKLSMPIEEVFQGIPCEQYDWVKEV